MHNWKDWKSVPMPARMQALEKDKRGFPVPFIVMRDVSGKPHFQINDSLKVEQAIKKDLCTICGEVMAEDKHLVGGPLSAFHEHGAYIDPCMHGDCARYALMVCPFLAVTHYNSRIDLKSVKEGDFPETVVFMDPTIIAGRPVIYVLIHISGFTRTPENGYLVPNKPYVDVEFWQHGNQLATEEGIKIIQDEYNE